MSKRVRDGWKRKGERMKERAKCDNCKCWKEVKVETSKVENFQIDVEYKRVNQCSLKKDPDRCDGPHREV